MSTRTASLAAAATLLSLSAALPVAAALALIGIRTERRPEHGATAAAPAPQALRLRVFWQRIRVRPCMKLVTHRPVERA